MWLNCVHISVVIFFSISCPREFIDTDADIDTEHDIDVDADNNLKK